MTHTQRGPRSGPFPLVARSRRIPETPFIPPTPTPGGVADPPAYVIRLDDPADGHRDGPALPRLLSGHDVGTLFNRSPRTLRRWIRDGHLAPVRIGGALFFDPDDIRRLIAGRLCAAVLEARRGRAKPAGTPPAKGPGGVSNAL